MTTALRIIIADHEWKLQELRETLPLIGHHLLCVADNGRDLIAKCQRFEPDLVITDVTLPDMDLIDAVAQLHRKIRAPVLIFADKFEQELIDRCNDYYVSFLVKPVRRAQLEVQIPLLMRRFRQLQSLRRIVQSQPSASDDRPR